MKLIAEYNDYSLDTKIITEANEKGEKVKTYNIEGIFAQADTKNRNGRVYPKAVMKSAVEKYVREQVSQKRAVGELNHPEGPTVNLDKVSHLITDLKFEGNDIMGKALILDTPNGKIERMETEILRAPRADLYEVQVREYKNFLSLLNK